MSHHLHQTSKKTHHLQASIVQWSIPTLSSNVKVTIVVLNEKLNDGEVSSPAWEQEAINSYFIVSSHKIVKYTVKPHLAVTLVKQSPAI